MCHLSLKCQTFYYIVCTEESLPFFHMLLLMIIVDKTEEGVLLLWKMKHKALCRLLYFNALQKDKVIKNLIYQNHNRRMVMYSSFVYNPPICTLYQISITV